MRRSLVALVVALTGSSLCGCAGLEEMAVGRADRVDDAPFVIEYITPGPVTDSGDVLVLPVGLDDPRNRADWPAGRDAALQPLLAAMNAYFSDRHCCALLDHRALEAAGAPYLYLGSAESDDTPAPAAIERSPGAEYPSMVLYLEKPSAAWKHALAGLLKEHGSSSALWLAVGIAEYPKADRGAFGKQVHLGTGYSRPIDFLSAVDKPVEVVQITGALFDAQGNLVRAGGEGFYASDTLFRYQIFDVTQTIDHGKIARLVAEERRTDLPGAPLAWEVALRNLVEGLTAAPLR